ncbi:hypothetical protein [Magnetovibrio sp.]|uniref:hypothetical protein n=1 Tax=Magnetovibrio sp. TaxID=2024836 RepID=UPI002F92F4FB
MNVQSCDDCPGSVKCTSVHLHPILVRVFDLYVSGVRDKFDILFSLNDDDEEALELCDAQVSRDCWTKAALLAIAEVVGRIGVEGSADEELEERLYDAIRTARDAFQRFPWHLEELVEQAPALYGLIQEQCPSPELCDRVSKRAFLKACKDIVYAR